MVQAAQAEVGIGGATSCQRRNIIRHERADDQFVAVLLLCQMGRQMGPEVYISYISAIFTLCVVKIGLESRRLVITEKRQAGLPVEFARAPMRTVRTTDAGAVYAHLGTQPSLATSSCLKSASGQPGCRPSRLRQPGSPQLR